MWMHNEAERLHPSQKQLPLSMEDTAMASRPHQQAKQEVRILTHMTQAAGTRASCHVPQSLASTHSNDIFG
jgi:hypothetical protein